MNRSRISGVLLVSAVCAVVATLLALPLPAAGQTLETASGFVFPVKSATVVSTFDYQILTYMGVETSPGSKIWVVAPVCGVKAGDSISVSAGKFYKEVESTGLGMTFENLVVPTALEINGQTIKAFSAHDLPKGCVLRGAN